MSSLDIQSLLQANAADTVTQEARKAAAKGKRVLWLTCFYTAGFFEGLKPVIKMCADMGLRLFVVYGLSEADRELVGRMAAAGFAKEGDALFADMGGDDAAANVVSAMQAKGVTVDGVFSPHEHCQTLVGELAELLQLPGNTKQSYVQARDKRISRDVCRATGVPAPNYAFVNERDELKEIGERIGYPLVLKPTSGAASAGVHKCGSYTELVDKYDQVVEELRTNPLFLWNPGCTVGMLVENYIDGDEFDVDLLLWEGQLVYGTCNDNWATMEPTFLETGSNCPTLYPADKRQELIDYAYSCVKALGFTQGCFHVECKYTKDTLQRTLPDGTHAGQPMLIEVNPRMGGARTRLLYQEVYGVDLFENFVLSACGIPINPPRAEEPLCGMADYAFCAEKTGVLLHTRFLDHIKEHPNVMLCSTLKKAGDQVKGTDTGIPEWVGFITIKADTAEDAVELIVELVRSVEVPILAAGETKPNANVSGSATTPAVASAN